MYRGWILFYTRDVVDDPFDRFVAHAQCLELFRVFARGQGRRSRKDIDVPSNLPELIRALELRREFNRDSCPRCLHNTGPERMTLWEHFYFGAQLGGWGSSSWECYAGDEMYCADPLTILQIQEFASACTIGQSSQSADITKAPMRSNKPNLLHLPMELLITILSLLPLKSAGSVKNTCCKGRKLLGEASPFWRARAISMHGDWFWELKDDKLFPQYTTAWSQVLWQIENARSKILAEAGPKPLNRRGSRLKRAKHCWSNIYRPMLFDSEGRRKLPLGLQNRLRIWCCLESIRKAGTQIALQGQHKGLDPSNVEWDGSRYADCPSCDRKNAISFNRLKRLAGRTDLT